MEAAVLRNFHSVGVRSYRKCRPNTSCSDVGLCALPLRP